MPLNVASPSRRYVFRRRDSTIEIFSGDGATLLVRIIPDSPTFIGWNQYGDLVTGGGFQNFLLGSEITFSSFSPENRNLNSFTFRTAKVKFNDSAAPPPFNLIKLSINRQEILSGPVVITSLGIFIDLPLNQAVFSVPENSLWESNNDGGGDAIILKLFA